MTIKLSEQSSDELLSLIVTECPKGFFEYLNRRWSSMYHEVSEGLADHVRWSPAEKQAVRGDHERNEMEVSLREAAEAHGLAHRNAEHFGKNMTYVKVKIRRFSLSAHRVPAPGHFVSRAKSRQQNAAVNRFMGKQPALKGALCVPLPELASAERIQIYVLHGSSGAGKNGKEPFLQLAVPDSELEGYHSIYAFTQLMQGYLAQEYVPSSVIEDKAVPKPKRVVKEEEK